MAPARLAERNVRPARAGSEVDDDVVDFDGFASASEDERSEGSEDDVAAGNDQGDDEVLSGDDVDAEAQISSVSFGALKKAQDAIVKKRKRGSDTTAEQDEKLEALRARLRQMKQSKERSTPSHPDQQSSKKRKSTTAATNMTTSQDVNSDSDSAPSEVGATKSRSSKHAPVSKSSRYQVTRKRNVVDVPKRVTRDPRFDAFNQNSSDPGNAAKAYSFLRDYQKDEIAELKAAVKQAKTEEDKETLKRKLISMQNRLKTEDAKEREQNVLRQHRKEEKQRVEQGKQPYFLKRKEVKDRALVEKFKDMKGKDREKLIERRRRKEGQREKKMMPEARRVGD
ncbi:rRNA biogenesis protein rrp36 [Saxophila tyrrhenica]|uniref:rRNA biogenesis protein RRP36 n=1 Tax=Saxophila tyrrhenica TaxID=1690608 RepID=A0AAV9PJR9_9PEZI|nr:rRNA biogenesis protein rrp36 [Saxophila tyrrhenica]